MLTSFAWLADEPETRVALIGDAVEHRAQSEARDVCPHEQSAEERSDRDGQPAGRAVVADGPSLGSSANAAWIVDNTCGRRSAAAAPSAPPLVALLKGVGA
ncbi:hypothetical protein [Saccharopolyspora spinosa]|uniref:Uncharacterized protein n=1 Tax=Saccharopolyspora spinosa TaxID=60894 RepID=A0A2N3YA21_SACSN|nr:hypothetical protein [Saccharopolyspora spinosa]PKW19758.1 hypothetical protein A8926_7946 [Saccharopolyspora spinosa]